MDIIKHNLKLMESTEEGGMQNLLFGESMGGNAGTITYKNKDFVCSAANFRYEKETGKIIIFSNYPQSGLADGTFKIAISSTPKQAEKKEKWAKTRSPIIEIYLEKGTATEAKNTIIASVSEYNENSPEFFKDFKIRIIEIEPLSGLI